MLCRRAAGLPFLLSSVLMFAFVPPAVAQKKPILFQHVRVFDGEKIIPDTNVLIQGGLIREIGPDVSNAEARIVDGHGKTLLPGLIDAHTHIHSQEALRQALMFGVTSVLDMGTGPRFMQMLKRSEDDSEAAYWSAGMMATTPGGHGTEYGMPIETLTSARAADGWVGDRVREGSDYIKIIYDDGTVIHPRYARPMLSRDVMAALVEAAHKRKKMAVVHIESAYHAREAIEAGADGLAHMYYGKPDADLNRLLVAHRGFVVATLTVHHSVCGDEPGEKLLHDTLFKRVLSHDAVGELKRNFPTAPVNVRGGFTPPDRHPLCSHFRESISALQAAGVPVLAGTDAPNPGTTQGASLHQELEYLVASGLTPAEALAAATSQTAKAFHIPDRGRIAAGLRADLLLVNGRPDENILATRDVVAVYKKGVENDEFRKRSGG